MDEFIAYLIGYMIMSIAGLAVVLTLAYLLADRAWRLLMAGMDLRDATEGTGKMSPELMA